MLKELAQYEKDRAMQLDSPTIVEVTQTHKHPDHLFQLVEDFSAHLTKEQREHLEQVIADYQNVFAADELEQEIDAKDAKPIKQRLSREGEAYVKEMPGAGVIQEPEPEWAPASVLTWK